MSKSKVKDDFYEESEARAARLAKKQPQKDKRKEKRVIRALKTRNIDELLQYDEFSSIIEKGEEDADL